MRAIPLLLGALASAGAVAQDLETLRRQVWAAECEFAATMARRDLPAFERHLSESALFFTGPQPLRGKAAVAAGWRRFYESADAPFSWEPDQVEVLGDGTLAHSTGPVRSPKGELIGRFFSVWRMEPGGQWRIVMDRGGPPDAKPASSPSSSGRGCESKRPE